MKIYKMSFIKSVLLGGAFSALLIWGALRPETPFWVDAICVLFVVLIIILFPSYELTLTDSEITFRGFFKSVNMKWADIIEISMVGDPDSPFSFFGIQLRTANWKNALYVPADLFSDYRGFLNEVLARLPSACEVDPNLKGLAEHGKGFLRKKALAYNLNALKQGLCLFFVLLFIIWLLMGVLMGHWIDPLSDFRAGNSK